MVAILYDHATNRTITIIYEQFQQVSLHAEALLKWLNRRTLSHVHPFNRCTRTVWELFEGGGYFVQLEPEIQCGNNSRAGRIQGNKVNATSIFIALD